MSRWLALALMLAAAIAVVWTRGSAVVFALIVLALIAEMFAMIHEHDASGQREQRKADVVYLWRREHEGSENVRND